MRCVAVTPSFLQLLLPRNNDRVDRSNSALNWLILFKGIDMKCIGWLLLGCGAFAGLFQPVKAQPPTLHFASLEWLPYVGGTLPQGGMSAAVARAAAARFGYGIKIDYLPWKRAMQAGAGDAEFAGYFPAYHTAERARQCHFSAPMGHSTIGFAVRAGEPLRWRTLDDLASDKLGVVLGYSNGKTFDAMVAQGKLSVDPSVSDTINLKKLLAGRVRAVVIDKAVLRYLLSTDSTLGKERERLAFDDHPLDDLTLHVCFQRTAQGQKMQQSYDAALLKTDIAKIENEYFEQLSRAAGAARR
jgi:polar amino acid transport system substrate-binding protein